MGLFDRFKGKGSKGEEQDLQEQEVDVVEEQESKPKKRKGLAGIFSRNKQEKGIVESMGLNEAVASMGLSVLEGIVESGDPSAVREVDEGYTVIALTEEMLQDLDVDTKSSDFGTFANAISSEHIESLLLENDLNNGIVVLIPDRDTLDILEEFSFLEDTAYRWAIIPFDIDDDSSAVLLENGATLGDLNVIAGEDMDLFVKNGQIVTDLDGDDDVDEFPNNDNEDDVFEGDLIGEDSFDMDDPFGADDDDVFGGILDDDLDDSAFGDSYGSSDGVEPYMVVDVESDDDDNLTEYEKAQREEELFGDPNEEFKRRLSEQEIEDEEDLFDFDYGDDEDDYDDYDLDDLDDLDIDDDIDSMLDETPQDEQQTVEEGHEMIATVLDREFHNDELGLSIKGDAFNQQFGDVRVVQFDDEPLDDGVLSLTVSEMRRDANTRLQTLHTTNLQKIRSHYQNGLSDIHDKLVEILDYKDSETAFGERYTIISNEREDQLDVADELVAQNREILDRKYDEQREAYGERAKLEAFSKFDDQNKDIHELEKRKLGDEVETKIELEFDAELAELYDERRSVAKRIFDKMTTGLLLEIQKLHEENMAHEHELYEKFHAEIDVYTRENYTDEVMRARAIATQQRQHHEADDVRKEYEQILATKQAQLQEAEAKADAELRKLENSHSKAIQETVGEYKRQVAKREDEIRELRENSNKLQNRIVEIGKEKDEEYSQRIRTNNDVIESQRDQIAYEQERADKQGRQSGILLVGMVIVGLAVGLLGGFLLGAQRSEPVQQAPAPASTVLLLENDSVNSIDSLLNQTFNQLFEHDATLVSK